jgi:hypothetical protein
MLNPQFGSGVLYGIPNAGNLVTNPTPMQFGLLQEVQLQFKGDLKKLYGTQQFALAIARGKVDVSGKGKIASLDPMFFSQLYFGQATAAGVQRPAYNEAHAAVASLVPSNTPVADLGVIVTGGTGFNVGTQMTSATAAPTVSGTYQFTAGTYKFLAADVTAGLTVAVNYTWNDSTHGYTLAIANQAMGYAPQFQALLYNNFKNQLFAAQLNACVLGTVQIPSKQEDFWVSDFDFEASADFSGNIGALYADQL